MTACRKLIALVVTSSTMLIGVHAALAGDSVVVQPGQPSVVVQPGQPSVTVQPSTPSVTVQPAPPTIVQPAPSTTVVVPPPASVSSASPNIQGTVHQSDTVKVDKTKGDIEMPSVVASVIYADTIKARSVVAEHIYVRDLKKN
jgi:hypothetical protein